MVLYCKNSNTTESEMIENLKVALVICPVATVIFVGCSACVGLAVVSGILTLAGVL